MPDDPYEIAMELYAHPEADDVRASHGRIAVAHIEPDNSVNSIPESLFEHIQEAIEGTTYQYDHTAEPTPDLVSAHSITGGVHHDSITGTGRELQVNLVQ